MEHRDDDAYEVEISGQRVHGGPVSNLRIDARSSMTFIAESDGGMYPEVTVRWKHDGLADEQVWSGELPSKPS